jgi:hypothetical protein
MSVLEAVLLVIAFGQSVLLLLKPWMRIHTRLDGLRYEQDHANHRISRLEARVDSWEDTA